MRKFLLILLTLATLLPTQDSFARMFKWVDGNGEVQYTQHPPVGRSATEIKAHTSPVRDEDAKKQLDALQERAEERRLERKLGAEKAARLKKTKEDKQKNCLTARKNLEVLMTAPRIRDKNTGGEFVYLDEKTRQKRLDATRQQIKENCK